MLTRSWCIRLNVNTQIAYCAYAAAERLKLLMTLTNSLSNSIQQLQHLSTTVASHGDDKYDHHPHQWWRLSFSGCHSATLPSFSVRMFSETKSSGLDSCGSKSVEGNGSPRRGELVVQFAATLPAGVEYDHNPNPLVTGPTGNVTPDAMTSSHNFRSSLTRTLTAAWRAECDIVAVVVPYSC